MNKLKNIKYTSAFACGLLLLSCSAPRHTMKQQQVLPDQFARSMDSTHNIAVISRDQFFKDPLLQALIRDVLEHNPDLNIALQRVHIAGAWFRMSRGALLPSVQASGNTSATKFGKHTMEGVGNYDTNLSPNIEEDQKVGTNPTPDFWLGLSASWELDVWGKLRKLKKAARLRYLASAQGVQLVTAMLTAQTTQLYYELIALDNELRIIRKNVSLQERAVEIVEAQKAGGRATELAVQQFKAQLLNTQSAAYPIRQRITEIENGINTLAGRYEGKIPRSESLLLQQHFYEGIGTGIPAQLLQSRPDVLQAKSELEASNADVAAARAAFFPTINLSAYSAFNAFKGNLLFASGSLGYQLLGGITAPVFQKHQLRSQFRVAGATQEQAFFNYQKAALNAYREVADHLSAIDNTQQMYLLKEKEVAALELGILISNDLYLTGYASYLEIVAAQKSKLEAELQLINTQRSKIQALVALYQALGGGWK